MSLAPAPMRIAIVDESAAFTAAAAAYIAALPGCVLAATVEGADVVLFDLGCTPARGLQALRRLGAAPGAPAIIAMTLFHSPDTASAAVAAGAVALVGKDMFAAGLAQALASVRAGA